MPVNRYPGLHVYSGPWHGRGYCGICGSREIWPRKVAWWDPDDGWQVGVLCFGCAEYAQAHGPQSDDYAWEKRNEIDAIDMILDLGAEPDIEGGLHDLVFG